MKAQSKMPIAIVICAIIFTAIMLVAKYNADLNSGKREAAAIEDLQNMIRYEVGIAAKSEDGYSREFEVPTLLSAKEYNIEIYQELLTLSYKPNYLSRTIVLPEKVSGRICRGKNTIKKNAGIISVQCQNSASS